MKRLTGPIILSIKMLRLSDVNRYFNYFRAEI